MKFKEASDSCGHTATLCQQYLEKQGGGWLDNIGSALKSPYQTMGRHAGGKLGKTLGSNFGSLFGYGKQGGRVGRGVGRTGGGMIGSAFDALSNLKPSLGGFSPQFPGHLNDQGNPDSYAPPTQVQKYPQEW